MEIGPLRSLVSNLCFFAFTGGVKLVAQEDRPAGESGSSLCGPRFISLYASMAYV